MKTRTSVGRSCCSCWASRRGGSPTAIDGVPVTQLGVDRAFASLRGQPGTTVAITLRRDERYLQLVVERRPLGSGTRAGCAKEFPMRRCASGTSRESRSPSPRATP